MCVRHWCGVHVRSTLFAESPPFRCDCRFVSFDALWFSIWFCFVFTLLKNVYIFISVETFSYLQHTRTAPYDFIGNQFSVFTSRATIPDAGNECDCAGCSRSCSVMCQPYVGRDALKNIKVGQNRAAHVGCPCHHRRIRNDGVCAHRRTLCVCVVILLCIINYTRIFSNWFGTII